VRGKVLATIRAAALCATALQTLVRITYSDFADVPKLISLLLFVLSGFLDSPFFWTVRDDNTLKRELKPLDSISDHNPK